MRVAVPTETKPGETRVGLTPDGVRELVAAGHRVVVQAGAGAASAFPDGAYRAAGATVVSTAAEVYEAGHLVVKVKEPQPGEVTFLRRDHVLFTYLHLAAQPALTAELAGRGLTAIGYETVALPSGALPLLSPMSEIAGRVAAQVSARFLEEPQGGPGVLLGGAPGVPPARAAVLGAGRVGSAAALALAGLGAVVTVLDSDIEKLRQLESRGVGRITTRTASAQAVEDAVRGAHVAIGAVLVAGAAAPTLVDEGLVRSLPAGTLLIDVAIDQGGVFATSRETTHADPIFDIDGVRHYAVGNIPAAVPHTSTYALTNATLPYVVALAAGVNEALDRFPELRTGVNVRGGSVVHSALTVA